jgi:hypothetical protein
MLESHAGHSQLPREAGLLVLIIALFCAGLWALSGMPINNATQAHDRVPAAMTLSAAPQSEEVIATASIVPAAQNGWSTITKPTALYAVQASEFALLKRQYTVRQHVGLGRIDRLVWGDSDEAQPYLLLNLHRHGEAGAPSLPLFNALARHLAETSHAIMRMGASESIETKFAMAEAADLRISGLEGERACLGFRVVSAPVLTITGLVCGTQGHGFDKTRLACLIDRLTLASGKDDKGLRETFALAERNRDNARCAPAKPLAAGRKPGQS